MNRRRRIIIIGLACSLVLLSSMMLWSPRPSVPLPKPNGYDDFLAAAAIVRADVLNHRTDSPKNYADMLQISKDVVAACPLAFELVRTGLKKECRVPLPDCESYHCDYLNNISDLAGVAGWALARAAEVAKANGNTNEAARIWMQAIHFAHESSRGGLLAGHHQLLQSEEGAVFQFDRLLPSLDAAASRLMLLELRQIDSRSEKLDEILKRDREWRMRNVNAAEYLKRGRFKAAFEQITHRKSNIQRMQKGEAEHSEKANLEQKRRKQLLLKLASRVYELERHEKPRSVADLIPRYLDAVPVNPETGEQMTALPMGVLLP